MVWQNLFVEQLHPDPHSLRQTFNPVDAHHDKRYHRHVDCWLCIVRWTCCGGGSNQRSRENQRRVSRHFAILSAHFFDGRIPSVRAWLKGLRALHKSQSLADEKILKEDAVAASTTKSGLADLGVKLPGQVGSEGVPSLQIAQTVAHFAKLSNAAYGYGIHIFTHPCSTCWNFCCCKGDGLNAFQLMSGVPREDIYYESKEYGPFRPKFYLFFDRAVQAVVVSIRGTFSTHDVATDLAATQGEHCGHTMHHGIFLSCKYVHSVVVDKIRSFGLAQVARGEVPLVLTGHSLGGSVASLVAWMLRSSGAYQAFSFTFGAPPLSDHVLTTLMESFAINVINHKDMMPCISVATFDHIKERVLQEAQPTVWRLSRLEATLAEFHLSNDPNVLQQELTNLFQGGERQYRDCAEEAHLLPTIKMYNPGWQIHLRRLWTSRWPCLEWFHQVILMKCSFKYFTLIAWTPPKEHFHTIRFSTTMWFDHFPFTYQYVCETYAERLHGNHRGDQLNPHEPLATALRRVTAYLQSANRK